MTVTDFLSKHVESAHQYGVVNAGKFAAKEALQQVRSPDVPTDKPDGVISQDWLLKTALADDDPLWVIWLDGGRVDYFKRLVDDYFDGELYTCWNGGIGYSGDWADRHLRRDMSGYGLFSVSPVRSLQRTDYDGRDYFDIAPEIDTGDSLQDRLAALGYREQDGDTIAKLSPERCNQAVREYLDQIDGGVIRYLKPHPPFEGLKGMTSGSQKTRATWHAIWSGELTHDELANAYVATYRQAFEAAADIVPELDGTVILTADHGECLGDCGQLYHSREHDTHRHLCEVPWFVVDNE